MPYAKDQAGHIWEIDAQGNPIRLAQQAEPQMPTNPEFPYKGPQAEAQLGQTQATTGRTVVQTQGDRIDNQVKGATAPFQIQKAAADAAAAQAAADKTRREQEALAQAERIKQASAQLGGDEVLRAIGRARGLTSGWSTGLANQALGWMGNTQAHDLNAQINTLKGNTLIDKLMSMKEASPNGASGMGALNESEGNALRDSISAIDPTQSEGEFRQGLNAVEDHYRKLNALKAGADIHRPSTWDQFGIQRNLRPADAERALGDAEKLLRSQIANLPPRAQQVGLGRFNANPDIQALRRRVHAPRKAARVIDFNDLP